MRADVSNLFDSVIHKHPACSQNARHDSGGLSSSAWQLMLRMFTLVVLTLISKGETITEVQIIKALSSDNRSATRFDVFPQDTHSPPTGRAPPPLPPSLCTIPQVAWFHCEVAAWTSCRPCGGGTLGPCQCSPGWVQPARTRAAGWGARWKAGSPPCNWTSLVCARCGWPRTAWVCSAPSGDRRHRQTASPCPPWRESLLAPCPLVLQWSRCWSVWTSRA